MFRYSLAVRNAGLDGRVAEIGPTPVLKICGEDGAELVTMFLPAKWMGKAEDGEVKLRGLWQGTATGKGIANTFCIYDAAEKTAHIDGDIPADMSLDNPHIAPDQTVTVSAFTIKAGNAITDKVTGA